MVTAPDYEQALQFYRDVLGLPERAAYASPGGRVSQVQREWLKQRAFTPDLRPSDADTLHR